MTILSKAAPAQPEFKLTNESWWVAFEAVKSKVFSVHPKLVVVNPDCTNEYSCDAPPMLACNRAVNAPASGLAAIKNDKRYVWPTVRLEIIWLTDPALVPLKSRQRRPSPAVQWLPM